MSFVAELIRCNFAIAQALAYVDDQSTTIDLMEFFTKVCERVYSTTSDGRGLRMADRSEPKATGEPPFAE
jgi:hypothetical protein